MTPGIPPIALISIVNIFKGILSPKKEKIRSQASSAPIPENTQSNICDNFSFFIINNNIIIPDKISSENNKLIRSPDNLYVKKQINMYGNFD